MTDDDVKLTLVLVATEKDKRAFVRGLPPADIKTASAATGRVEMYSGTVYQLANDPDQLKGMRASRWFCSGHFYDRDRAWRDAMHQAALDCMKR